METAAFPSGTVAFLFTDIEGSTRRWEAFGEAMRDAVRRHDAILRTEIERRRGYVFKTIGDAFCAAFWNVEDALEAAVGVQRQLALEDFSGVDDLRVRIAIAAGQADERDGDYFGMPVNRTARLLSAGHGGQILVSGIAADLLASSVPDGIALRHLGTLTLRDVKEPERVYQAVAPELRAQFRPLRALETPPNNLPSQATSFVGRERDVIAIEDLLETEALVTVVGAGGMGKTRLALETASATLNDRKDGAWFVDLAALSDPALVISVVLSTLGVDRTQDVAALDALVKYLEERELLLVLDNCEHVIAEVARIVAALLSRCRYVTILATSREALDVSGEHVYRISSLDLAAAMHLFNERARSANASFSPEAEAQAVEAICRRVDGIALAIELAAARVRTISPQALSEHLGLKVLAGGRDRQPRQKTMRALIDWSYDLLNPQERDFLRRCAPCMGGLTLESAIAFSGGDDVVTIDLLSSLVDKSLVAADEMQARYRLLEPIREYAFEKLEEAGETQGALELHARAYAALAHDGYEEWDTDPAPDWLARMGKELGNFRAALHWSVGEGRDRELGAALASDAAPVFMRLSLLTEGIAWCESALGANVLLSAAIEARLHYVLSMLCNNQGDDKTAFAQARRAADAYRRSGDSRGTARALSQLAHRSFRQNLHAQAKTSAEEALALTREIGNRRLLAEVLRQCAFAFSSDDKERMRAMQAESVALFRSLGKDDETARALWWWGLAELEAGEYDGAAEHLLEARKLAGEDVAAGVSNDIATCYLMLGDRENAVPAVRDALELAVKSRHPVSLPYALIYAAVVMVDANPAEAARLYGYAEKCLEKSAFEQVSYDRAIAENLKAALEERLSGDLMQLLAQGAAFSEDEAIARALNLEFMSR